MRKKTFLGLRGIILLLDKILILLDFICAFLEMHLVKIVSFSIMALCCYMVNALHLVIVFVLLLFLIIGTSAMKYAFSFIGLYLSILFLSKMVYQTKFVSELDKAYNCSANNITFQSILENTTLDPEWWGFIVMKNGNTIIDYYKGYILVFLVMTFQTVIRIRQRIARIDAGASPSIPSVLFVKTTRKEADRSLRECLKFLINYGFYKFGIEITLSFCVFVIAFRMDIFSVIYAVWIAILFLLQRTTLFVIWPFFMTTLIFSILWQYAMAVGLSEKACFQYPWSNHPSLAVWMFLPRFESQLDTSKTLVDFILLLLIQRQQTVFELEKKHGDKYPGGSNKETYMDHYKRDFVNPTPDHTKSIRSWIEVMKFLFMSCLFRITLAFEFWNGASNANLLSLGYLVGAFVFLWIDYDLCLWHIKKILKWWNTLLAYTVFVILVKTLLEFAGCVYVEYLENNLPWLVEFLVLRCTSTPSLRFPHIYSNESHFYWDLVCFTLAIFQRRHFQSYYFVHEVDDVMGVFRLQAKGAKLMDELQENKLKGFQLRERKTLTKIKKNMNRIKAWQKRMQGLNYNEPTDHATAIYMGDYFMFEDLEEVSSQLDESSSSSDEYEYDESGRLKKFKYKKKLTMSEFIGTVFKRAGEESGSKISKLKESGSSHSLSYEDDKKEIRRGKTSSEEKNRKTRSDKEKGRFSESIPEEKESDESGEEKEKLKKTWRLFRAFLDSLIVTLIRFFNKNSRDYRYIESMMKAERRKQKENRRESSRDPNDYSPRNSEKPISSGRLDINSLEEVKRLSLRSYESRSDDLKNPYKKSSQALLVNLINAICMFIMSQTELLCYMIIFLHTVLSPTLISLPLPLLVFLWGSLTALRPTKTFWTVLIAYTEVTVVIKALFQNSIFSWNSVDEKDMIRPEYPPLFLGIHRDNQYVIADLFLLLLLFFHRYKLKTLGLWNRTHEEETQMPQNLMIYKELPSEKDFKDVKGNRSLLHQRKRLITELTDANDSISHFLRMATWKCTSKATAKLTYRGNKLKTKIQVKEIEGTILVTHDGRRLEPTGTYVSQVSEEALEGNVVLRVYVNDVINDTKSLFYKLSWVQHFTSLRKFFVQILVRDWRVSADFYTLMFVFEFTNFLIVFFAYSSFTDSVQISSEDFSLAANQVPIMYLFTMIAHFLVIVIDRILYLRKNLIGKLILQFILVILVHVWMFIVIPVITESPFNRLHVPQTYYMISCLYFLMSAYQLRVGYPMRVQGHFLCKKYGYVNFYAYKGLQFIPFFNQLRTILDFLCTHSSLTMIEWIKMESMFQIIYENKCSRRADIYYPVPRGQECPKCPKYTPGIFVLFGMIIVIWLPFIIFALFNTVAQPNLPQEASLIVQIGNFGKIFVTKATFTDIITLTSSQFTKLQSLFKDRKKVWSFLSQFDSRDVAVLKFRFEPYEPWIITPKEFLILNETIQNKDIPLSLYCTWNFQRLPRSQIVANARGHSEIILNKTSKARYEIASVLLNKSDSVRLDHILPKFVHITNEGEAKPVSGFLNGDNRTNPYRNVTLSLEFEQSSIWWKLLELSDDAEEKERISKIPFQSSREITIYTFNEKNIPKLLLNVSKKGIIGLYLSIVFFTWSIIRRLMWKYPYLMFDDMPNPDPVLKLCQDIYLARESHDFALEEDLYAKLLFLFRSPETMIKVTRLNALAQG